eukprot:COSAG05_NODE_90_length_20140_cov_25.117060_9_plen_146_part_00
MASDPQHHTWINCTAQDCASCCENPSMVHAPGTGAQEQWWRYQDCVASCAGNALPRSCTEEQVALQFPEPAPNMSSLWSGWQWCGARRVSSTVAAEGQLGDSPGHSCSADNPMIATNIVDQVQIPATIEPGAYLLSWRWDCKICT